MGYTFGRFMYDVAVAAAAQNQRRMENFRRASGRDWEISEGRDNHGYYTLVVRRDYWGHTSESRRYYESYRRMQQAYDSWRRPF